MQPKPIGNDNPHMVDLVLQDNPKLNYLLGKYYEIRKKQGITKYGVALQSHNGRDAVLDLRDELGDAVLYARQCIEEGKTGIEPIYEMCLTLLIQVQKQIMRR